MSYVSLRDCPHEIIITIGNGVEANDLMLFFDFDREYWERNKEVLFTHYQHFDTMKSWEDLAVELQMQPSKGQARKNGWTGPIPIGYSELKRKLSRFYILHLPENI